MSDTARSPRLGAAVAEELYMLVLAGVAVGVAVVGLGSRAAMLVLRLTSPHSVRGVVSDDGFTIGRVTLGGTYNLLALGAVVGVIGAAAYQWVRPWLIGPSWFRRLTVALASGAVVGSMLVHADGIDFTVLAPTWLAIALFVALPAAFATCVSLAVDRVDRRLSGHRLGRRDWIAPALLVAAFPVVLGVLAVVSLVLVPWVMARDLPAVQRLAGARVTGAVARVAWLGIAVVGLVTLVADVGDVFDAA